MDITKFPSRSPPCATFRGKEIDVWTVERLTNDKQYGIMHKKVSALTTCVRWSGHAAGVKKDLRLGHDFCISSVQARLSESSKKRIRTCQSCRSRARHGQASITNSPPRSDKRDRMTTDKPILISVGGLLTTGSDEDGMYSLKTPCALEHGDRS